jgi:hypothetical protein
MLSSGPKGWGKSFGAKKHHVDCSATLIGASPSLGMKKRRHFGFDTAYFAQAWQMFSKIERNSSKIGFDSGSLSNRRLVSIGFFSQNVRKM